MQNTSGIADCMYMILLNNSKYYEKIDKKYKDIITRSLYKIEIMVDVARLYNDHRVLKFVEKTLDLDNIEVNLFSVCTLIYNNIPISDAYIEELA